MEPGRIPTELLTGCAVTWASAGPGNPTFTASTGGIRGRGRGQRTPCMYTPDRLLVGSREMRPGRDPDVPARPPRAHPRGCPAVPRCKTQTLFWLPGGRGNLPEHWPARPGTYRAAAPGGSRTPRRAGHFPPGKFSRVRGAEPSGQESLCWAPGGCDHPGTSLRCEPSPWAPRPPPAAPPHLQAPLALRLPALRGAPPARLPQERGGRGLGRSRHWPPRRS